MRLFRVTWTVGPVVAAGKSEHSMKRSHVIVLILVGLVSLGMSGGTCNVNVDDVNVGGGGNNNDGSGGDTSNTGNGGGSTSPSVSYSALQQLSLERINRARLRPVTEAARYSISLNEGIPDDEQISTSPKQPLAMNATLNSVAKAHSQDMIDRDYFAHNTLEGVSPFVRITNAGYTYTSAGENLAWRGTTGPLNEAQEVEKEHQDLFVDDDFPGRGHRAAMLNAEYREVGIGIVRGDYTQDGTVFDSLMQTQDYGTPSSDNIFVLGVVYNDNNSNGQYDYGEGTASVTVTLGVGGDSTPTTTNQAGGYSFEVTQAGTYTLSFSSGQAQAITISSGAPNIKVDLVDGGTLVINLGLGPLG